ETAIILFDGRDRTASEDSRAGLLDATQQLLMIAGRVDGRVLTIDDAAVVDICAQLRVLLGARHDVRFDLEPLRLIFDPARQGLVLGLVVCSVETPNDREIAVHLFVFDELAEPGQRVLALLQDVEGPLGAVSAGQPIVARLDSGTDLGTVAPAGPPAGIPPVQAAGVADAAPP